MDYVIIRQDKTYLSSYLIPLGRLDFLHLHCETEKDEKNIYQVIPVTHIIKKML